MSEFSRKSDEAAVKRALALDIKESKSGRAEIAYQLSLRVGRSITLAQLDAFTSETKINRFPLDLLAAWVMVTGSRRLLDLVVSATGYFVADERDQKMAAYGRTILGREALQRNEERLRAELGDVR
jgi:hypothetical protein